MTETSGLPPQAPPLPPPAPSWGSPDPHGTGYSPPRGPYGQQPYGQPSSAQSPPRLKWATRPFLRSRDDRLVAGVAGGVGRSLGIDPLILRILFVVLAFFEGAGLLLYALGWLLLNLDDGRGRSLVEDAFDARTSGRGRKLLTVAALAGVACLSSIWVLSGRLVPVALIVLTVVALVVYARRDDASQPPLGGTGAGWPTPPSGQPYPGQPYPAQPYPGQAYPGQAYPGQRYPGGPQSGQPQSDQPYSSGPGAGTPYPAPPYVGPPSYGSAEPGGQPAGVGGAPPAPGTDHPPYDTATATDSSAAAGMEAQPTVVLTGGTEQTTSLESDPPSTGSHRYDPTTAAYPGSSPMWSTAVQRPLSPAPGPTPYGEPLGFGDPPGPPMGPPPRYQQQRPTEPRRQRHERSYLGLLTISVALLALGVLAVQDLTYAAVPGSAYVVLALGIVGAGLLVGTWVGRSRSLIVVGFLLSVALVPVVVIDAATDDDWSQLRGWSNTETRRESPATIGAIEPAYDIGSGRLVLDLRNVDFSGADVATSITMGAGEVMVFVPQDVDVVTTGSVDIGDLVIFGEQSSGIQSDQTVTRSAVSDVAGGSAGELDLTIELNVGSVEVR